MAPKFSTCSVDGCNNPPKARGWCEAHYQRLRRYGDPTGGGPLTTPRGKPREFFEAALIYQADDCLIWPYGRRGYTGYASMGSQGVHRLVCERVHGPPPSSSHQAAHSCGVRNCVNPRHIRWASKKENFADELMHGTRIRGTKSWNAKLTEDDVREIRRLRLYLSEPQIAAMFNVTRPTVASIMQRRTWAWLSD